jgi:hypothetical protein
MSRRCDPGTADLAQDAARRIALGALSVPQLFDRPVGLGHGGIHVGPRARV